MNGRLSSNISIIVASLFVLATLIYVFCFFDRLDESRKLPISTSISVQYPIDGLQNNSITAWKDPERNIVCYVITNAISCMVSRSH